MLRTLIVAVGISIYTLILGPPLLIYSAITGNVDPLYWAGVRGTLFFIRLVGVRFRVAGVEKIPPGVCLFIANHTSSADAPAVVGAIPRRIAIILKESLFRWPIVGAAFRAGHFIPVNRTIQGAAILAMDKAAEALREGQSFLVYPEGTRSPDGRLQEFKKGAAIIGIKSGVPIVPVACSGAHHVMAKRSLIVRPGQILTQFLDPIDPAPYSFEQRDALNARLHDAIASALPPDQQPAGFAARQN
jgi:1-acyl-sn-glycerol-3-phosphate acyltransferase